MIIAMWESLQSKGSCCSALPYFSEFPGVVFRIGDENYEVQPCSVHGLSIDQAYPEVTFSEISFQVEGVSLCAMDCTVVRHSSLKSSGSTVQSLGYRLGLVKMRLCCKRVCLNIRLLYSVR